VRQATLCRQSLALLIVSSCIGIFAGCGSGSQPGKPQFSGSTSVTVMLSSAANDQLSQFDLTFGGITLTDQSGNTVPLLSAAQGAEFIHLNGQIEPLVTATVPQGIYVSASATIGGADFTCDVLMSSGGMSTNTYSTGAVPQANVTVTLPSPVTVTGDNMGLLFSLLVSPSATFPSCDQQSPRPTYSINPTFNVTPVSLSSSPTNSANGKVSGLQGPITALNTSAGSFTLSVPEPTTLFSTRTQAVTVNSNTVYQGVGGFSSLAVQTFVDLDGAVQPDGSLVATRIAVHDPSAVDVMSGPVLSVFPTEPATQQPSIFIFGRLLESQGQMPWTWYYGIASSVFQISGEIDNLAQLPFPATFSLSNMVAGQNVYVSSLNMTSVGGIYTTASTITLLPQTINGVVSGTSQNGNFTVYSVSLSPYDFFSQFAVQQGQTTLLTNPTEIEVYVDSNAQLLNKQPLAAGSAFRFYGLVFNDSGTLRMDCIQVSDGVTQTSQPSPSRSQMVRGQVQQTVHPNAGGRPQTISMITSHQPL